MASKLKGKEWFQITAPKFFGDFVIGETIAFDPEQLKGRVVETSLTDITVGAVVVEEVEEEAEEEEAAAEEGEDFVRKQLAMDQGANKLGEFSLTDKRISRIDRFMANTLFDENYGGKYGNCHVALGASYTNTFKQDPKKLTKDMKEKLGFNDSALHWNFVNTEKKRVTAYLQAGNKTVIYENGKFTY